MAEFGWVCPTFSVLHWAAIPTGATHPALEYLPATHPGTPSATSVKGRWGITTRGTIISVFSQPVYLLKSSPNGSDMILLKAMVALTFAFVSERTGPFFTSQGKHHSRWCRLTNWQPWTLGSGKISGSASSKSSRYHWYHAGLKIITWIGNLICSFQDLFMASHYIQRTESMNDLTGEWWAVVANELQGRN